MGQVGLVAQEVTIITRTPMTRTTMTRTFKTWTTLEGFHLQVEEETHEVAPEVLEARLTMAEGRG